MMILLYHRLEEVWPECHEGSFDRILSHHRQSAKFYSVNRQSRTVSRASVISVRIIGEFLAKLALRVFRERKKDKVET